MQTLSTVTYNVTELNSIQSLNAASSDMTGIRGTCITVLVTVQTYEFVIDHAHTNYHDFADTGMRMSLMHIIAHQTLQTNSKQHDSTWGKKKNPNANLP